MKVISLNTWGGRAGKEKLLAFFAAHTDIDVFCLQEIWSDSYEDMQNRTAGGIQLDYTDIMVHGMQEISSAMSGYTAYFRPHHLDRYGLMMLVKKDLEVLSEGDEFVYKQRGYVPDGDIGFHARNVQFVTLATTKGNRSVLNFHGLWNGAGKGDSEDRLVQSDRIIKFMKTFAHPYVICGDFNLRPDTESLKKLEEFGLRNLIAEYGITSTRTSFYDKQDKFADYAFVSQGIEVKDFRVLPDEVSDHSPLYIEFE